jgi:hypothetical protein
MVKCVHQWTLKNQMGIVMVLELYKELWLSQKIGEKSVENKSEKMKNVDVKDVGYYALVIL